MWLGALGLLVLNDHALKGAGLLPGWLTGKLSDVAGMLVAPVILAVIVQVSSKRGWTLAHIAIGAVFAAIKLVPEAARAFETLTALTPFPWVIVVDPTDLLALPALLVSYRFLGRARETQGRYLESALATAGAIACMATSPPPCEGEECRPQPVPPQEQAALVFANGTNTQRLVRVRPLSSSLLVNCTTLLNDPSRVLTDDHFDPAQSWLLEPGRALPLRSQGECSAYLIDAQGLDPVLVAWNQSAFPETQLPTVTTVGHTSIIMRDIGGHLVVESHPAVFAAPAEEPIGPQPGCETPADTVGIDWSSPPLGAQQVVSIASSPDGCHLVELTGETFAVCLPLHALPFEVGETVEFYPWGEPGSGSIASGIVMMGQSTSIYAVRGDVLASDGDPEHSFEVTVEGRTGCGYHHDECSNVVQALDVTLMGSGVDGVVSGGAGDALALNNGTLHLVRAQSMPIRDTECAPYATSETYFESVLVIQNGGE
ncbi:MAG TPA: hypothetical protein VFB62_07765 [Polyangiaceae bacterium]|nr:hypothetical protein [Polyangiaceae bacterium]